ncbi:MAG: HAMP domain-containing protein [Planctomycetes bacterium]|nr:HAMP domain-containing protein [Planctomycetota bacterium]
MRDPLGNVPVRYKLALAFVGVCLLAFGVGGYLVSRSAMATLEDEILTRLRFQSEAYASALEGDLRALAQRARDFASDGHIRAQLEARERASGAEREVVEAELRRHLVENKLPLVPAFANLALVPRSGDLFPARLADGEWGAHVAAEPAEVEQYGALLKLASDAAPVCSFSTPLRTLDGTRLLGRLVVKINVGVWIAESLAVMRTSTQDQAQAPTLRLLDGSGQMLVIQRSLIEPSRPAPDSELVRSGFGLQLEAARRREEPALAGRGVFSRSLPISANGWTLETELDSSAALAAVSGLQSRFVLVGAVLTLAASLLLVFPMRFLARPLAQLERAARKIHDGDFSTRVEVESRDELGQLSQSFNLMAEAVEERTGALEASARALEQRQAELKKERDRLNAVILSMRDGLMVLDADGQPLVWNAAARPLVEIAAKGGLELRSHRLCQSARVALGDAPQDAAGACHRCLFEAAAPPRSCLVDAGASVWEVHSTPLSAEPDGRAGRVLVAREVSDRIAQDERQIHQERLAVLGEVAAVVAHELNNPLAAIRMFSQMLGRNLPKDSPLLEDVAVIERNIQACSRTIRDLLDYATGSSPEVGEIDVHETLEDVERFLRALRERKGAELLFDFAAPEAIVRGDEVQIRQVFVNLILNALQAGSSVHVVVRTSLEGNHLVIDVEDDGPGIPAENYEAIFRPFYTTKPRGEGTGLGLSTARRITEIQGGGLELVASRPGRTVFRVRLLRSPS